MPTVPSSFVPQVAESDVPNVAFQAPGIQPMENIAAKQEVEVGQRMVEAGMIGYRAGVALQDSINEADAKAGDAWAAEQMTNIVHGENGYLYTTGKNAIDGYASAHDALSSVAQSAMDRMKNDTQRQLLAPAVARNMLAFQTRITEHREVQSKNYLLKTSAARSERYIDLAVQSFNVKADADGKFDPIGNVEYHANLATAISEANTAADLMGLPADSDQRTQIVTKINTRVAGGIVDLMMSKKQYAMAEQFLDAHSGKEALDPEAETKMRKEIDVGRQHAVLDELTDNVMQHGVLVSPSDPKQYSESSDGKQAPATMTEALDIASNIKDVEMRRLVTTSLRNRYAQIKEDNDVKYRELIDSVYARTEDPNSTVWDIPVNELAALKPKDREDIMLKLQRHDEITRLEEIARNPEKLTNEYLDKYRDQLSTSTYLAWRERVNKPNPVEYHEVTLNAEQVNDSLVQNGFQNLVFIQPNDDESKAMSLTLRENIKREIDARQKDKGGKVLEYGEKQEIIDRHVHRLGRLETESTWGKYKSNFNPAAQYWIGKVLGDKNVQQLTGPVTSYSPDIILEATEVRNGMSVPIITDSIRKQIEASLKRNGAAVNPTNIVRTWIEAGMPR